MIEIISQLLNPLTIGIIIAGCVGGIILGAVPGLNGGIGISLMLPFTFTMSPADSLLLLGGIYMGSTYGGAISAILINVPGGAEAYCTMLEGHPMAKAKRGKEALYLAALASICGGLMGVIALIAAAPALARFALRFGPPEFFLIGMVGLTVVGSLTGKNALKGVASACFGLIIGMIGFDTISGGNRLNFGSDTMVMGIELMAVVLGFFALSEMLDQIVKIHKNKTTKIDQKDAIVDLGDITFFQTVKSVLKYNKFLLTKSCLIGTFLGILPGPGAAISAFVAYGEAKRSYPKESFGTGNPRGIIAAESSNNACVGGSLVPMMALGIPGSPTAAIMYGALVIHGLQIGPRLFVDNKVFAYTFSWGMLLTVVVMGIVGIFCVPLFSRILKVNMRYIILTVIMCSLLGAFSIRNSMFDVFVTIILGFVGYYLNKFGFPTAPIVLGLILSGLIERNFRLSLVISGAGDQSLFTYIFTRPLCIGIVVLGVMLILLNFRSMAMDKKRKT